MAGSEKVHLFWVRLYLVNMLSWHQVQAVVVEGRRWAMHHNVVNVYQLE